MGVDYTAVGGIGIEITDEIKGKLQKQVEVYDDMYSMLDEIGIPYSEAGSGNYTGEENEFFLMVDGDTFGEVKKNIKPLIEKLSSFGIEVKEDEFQVISELHVW